MPVLYPEPRVVSIDEASAQYVARGASHLLVRIAAVAAIALLYVAGALQHAERVNLVKRMGDQSAYLQYAKDLYANRQGQSPPIVGDRNRMPLYPAVQSLFYAPSMSDEEFFVVGRRVGVALSVGLLAIVWCCAGTTLPRHAAFNVALVAAFTCFAFKAGYVQADLTYYTLHFVAFATACRVLSLPAGGRAVALGALTGVAAALTHLTKAAALPLVALVTAALLGAALHAARGRAGEPRPLRAAVSRTCAAAALVLCFLAMLWPYLSTSKRVFGQYFYNVNSTFYMWYDEWGDAIKGTRAHGDRVGWPRLPADRIPGPAKYWREHSLQEIGARLAGGFRQMAIDLWSGFWALKFALLSTGLAAAAVWPRRAAIPALARRHWPVVAFVVLYFGAHATLTAFYAPISGTGVARFTLALYVPLLFVAAALRHHPALAGPGPGPTRAAMEWFITATLLLDIPFSIWPRLLSTYGGF